MAPEPAASVASPFDDGDIYDAMCADMPYGIDFYVGLAKEAKGPVLEIACGTGRITLPCLRAGADVDGLDLYQPMLDTLRRKAAAEGFTPTLTQGDMANFHLPRRYTLVTITFNAFIHNLTQEAQLSCLRCCRDHLRPGGLLAFDTFFPALAIVGAPENTRVLEGESRHPRTGLPTRNYDTRTFDRVAQTQHSINEFEELDAAGNVAAVHRSEFTTRYTYKAEMELLLRLAGFARWEVYGDFDRRPLTKETDAMIVLAWAA